MKQLLFFLCCCEVLLCTWCANVLGPYASSLLLFAASLGIAFLYLRIESSAESTNNWLELSMPSRVGNAFQWALFLAISYMVFSKTQHLWQLFGEESRLNENSDIIPQIRILVTRFLAGEQPYQIIHFTGYDLYPTYLPMQWLPYIITEWLYLDYRWIPTIALWLVSAYYFMSSKGDGGKTLWHLASSVWPLVVWYLFMINDNKLFVYTVEGLIAAYYLFVAVCLTKKSIIPLALGIALCMLSRYSIVFWVPLCTALYYMAGKRREAFLICGTVLVLFVVVYWVPFLRQDWHIFSNGYAYHTKAAIAEWQRDIDVYGGKVYLYNGMGFTSYAMKFLPGDVANKLAIYKSIHIIACLLSVVMLAAYYLRKRSLYNMQAFLLFSFKVYLTVFYAFIQIPYKYLFFVPVIVSAALLGKVFSNRKTITVKQ